MIRKAIDAYVPTLNKGWLLDRRQTVGASSVAQCARKVWFEKNDDDPEGHKPDPEYVDRYGAKIRGTMIEDHFWVPALRAAFGADLIWAGEDQRTFVLDFLSATPDGMLVNQASDALAHLDVTDIDGNCVVVESKSIDPRAKLLEAKPEHVFQAIVQMGLIRRLTTYKPSFAVISYINASWWDDIKEFPVRYDDAVFAEGHRRAADVMLAHAAHDLIAEGRISGSKDCQYCAWTTACGTGRKSSGRAKAAPSAIPAEPAGITAAPAAL
jgi:hypothetical protein